MKPLHRQNREFPFFEISCKPTMLQRNDYDFRNQRKILVLEMFEILGAQTLTKILLHCVMEGQECANSTEDVPVERPCLACAHVHL